MEKKRCRWRRKRLGCDYLLLIRPDRWRKLGEVLSG